MDSRKISWGYLSVEITRRCNLHCAHCMRGDAQDVDMDEKTMIDLLNKTKKIETLLFTGGEPFLNIDGMKRFLELLKERRIPLYFFQIITNGTVKNDSVIDLIKNYSEYISLWISSDRNYKADLQSRVFVSISFDLYHNTDSEDHYCWYKDRLNGIARVNRRRVGDFPSYYGNAKNLPYANHLLNANVANYICEQSKICAYTSECKDFPCEYMKFCNPEIDEIMIPCILRVTFNGELHYTLFDQEYDSDKAICNMSVNSADDILSAIQLYNVGKPYCKVAEIINAEIIHMLTPSGTVRKTINGITYDLDYTQVKNLELAYQQSQETGENILDIIKRNYIHLAARTNKPYEIICAECEKTFGTTISKEYVDECKVKLPKNIEFSHEIIPVDKLLSMQLALSTQRERYSTVVQANPSITKEQKETIDLLLQAYDSAKALYDINPDNKFYSNMLKQDERRLIDYVRSIFNVRINSYFKQSFLETMRNLLPDLTELK